MKLIQLLLACGILGGVNLRTVHRLCTPGEVVVGHCLRCICTADRVMAFCQNTCQDGPPRKSALLRTRCVPGSKVYRPCKVCVCNSNGFVDDCKDSCYSMGTSPSYTTPSLAVELRAIDGNKPSTSLPLCFVPTRKERSMDDPDNDSDDPVIRNVDMIHPNIQSVKPNSSTTTTTSTTITSTTPTPTTSTTTTSTTPTPTTSTTTTSTIPSPTTSTTTTSTTPTPTTSTTTTSTTTTISGTTTTSTTTTTSSTGTTTSTTAAIPSRKRNIITPVTQRTSSSTFPGRSSGRRMQEEGVHCEYGNHTLRNDRCHVCFCGLVRKFVLCENGCTGKEEKCLPGKYERSDKRSICTCGKEGHFMKCASHLLIRSVDRQLQEDEEVENLISWGYGIVPDV